MALGSTVCRARLLFLSHLFVVEWAMVARVDLLALALSLAALALVQARPGATATTLLAVLCVLLASFTRQTYAVAAMGAAATVGALRVVAGNHFPSDVLAGAGLGMVSSIAVYKIRF